MWEPARSRRAAGRALSPQGPCGAALRIDAHVHFFVYDAAEHPWVTDELRALRGSFLPAELEPRLRGSGFAGCVAVEARQSLRENDWLLELARSHPTIKGIVGWVDLCAPDVRGLLERLAVHPTIKGFRHVVIDEPDDGFLLRDDFRRGIASLIPYGFTYDLLIFPRHMATAVRLVQALPQQPFVLDHLGLPDLRAGELAAWAAALRGLAALPNVFCKLSGLAYRADWQRWKPEQLTPYLDVALELFGPKRLMIGSNWPVCTVAGAYETVVRVVLDWLRALSPDERSRIEGGTCAEFYRLE